MKYIEPNRLNTSPENSYIEPYTNVLYCIDFLRKRSYNVVMEVVKMNFVQPFRSREKLEEMKDELRKSGTRNYMMFYTGINTGLRISDLVKLNRDNIRNADGTMKSHITIVEQKTKKVKKFPICNGLLSELDKYTKNMYPRRISI